MEVCDFFGYNMTWCTNGFLKRLPLPQRTDPCELRFPVASGSRLSQ